MTTEEKALAMVNEVTFERGERRYVSLAHMGDAKVEALCRAIEQHEAFRREVSDALQSWVEGGIDRPAYLWFRKNLEQFIIAKPDPLEEVLSEIDHAAMRADECAKEIRASLDARGFEIREKSK